MGGGGGGGGARVRGEGGRRGRGRGEEKARYVYTVRGFIVSLTNIFDWEPTYPPPWASDETHRGWVLGNSNLLYTGVPGQLGKGSTAHVASSCIVSIPDQVVQ